MGKLPETFTGDQSKADNFIEEVKGYLCLNDDVSGFDSPKKKIAFTLTHMKGDDVAGWVYDIETLLDHLDLVDNVPLLWDQFLENFAQQYQDSAKEDCACTGLQKLHVREGDIDAYVSKFEELA